MQRRKIKVCKYVDEEDEKEESLPKEKDATLKKSKESLLKAKTDTALFKIMGEGRKGKERKAKIGKSKDKKLIEYSAPHIKFLCLNAYLIPPFVSCNPHLWVLFWSCRKTALRATMIGGLSRFYDIICLQEVWGTHLSKLCNAVKATHSILPESQSYSKFTLLNEILDPIRLYNRKTGGIWFAWRRSKVNFLSFDRMHFPQESRVPFSNQNVTVVEFDVSRVFHKKRLLVFNTHFSPFGLKPKSININTLQLFVSICLWKAFLVHLTFFSPDTDASDMPSAQLNNLAVILCGDFNVYYLKMIKTYNRLVTLNGCAKMRDLFLPQNNPLYQFQDTYHTQEADSFDKKNKKTGNSMFPWPFSGRVDYIFGIDSITYSAAEVKKLKAEYSPFDVLGGEFEDLNIPLSLDGSLTIHFSPVYCLGMDILKQPYGEEFSDHWPLSARLSLEPSSVVSHDSTDSEKFSSYYSRSNLYSSENSETVENNYSDSGDSKSLDDEKLEPDDRKEQEGKIVVENKEIPTATLNNTRRVSSIVNSVHKSSIEMTKSAEHEPRPNNDFFKKFIRKYVPSKNEKP